MFFTFHQIGSLESSNDRPRGEPFRDRAHRSGRAVTGGYRLFRQWCCIRYGHSPISDTVMMYIFVSSVSYFGCFLTRRSPNRPPNVRNNLLRVIFSLIFDTETNGYYTAPLSAYTLADNSKQAAQLSPRAPLTAKVHWTIC
jgi:hypothetical protein